MKRWPLKVVLVLLLGALLNVAVAWIDICLPIVRSHSVGRRAATGAEREYWIQHAPPQINDFQDAIMELSGDEFGLGMHRVEFWAFHVRYSVLHGDRQWSSAWRRHIEGGWPRNAFVGELWSWSNAFSDVTVLSTSDSLVVHRDGEVFLPCRPSWPGFAINTVFYAAILWLLFAAPLALRRRLRLKRGLCPACAYPIGASDVCTECGKPVKARSVEQQT